MGAVGRMVDTSPTVTSPQEGGGVAVVCDMVPVVTDLSIPVLLCQIVAKIVGTVQIRDGLGLVRGRGDKDFVTHVVWLTVPVL